MALPIDFAKKIHPLYTQYLPKWDFYLESVKGGEDYTKNENNLFTHRLESSAEDYTQRKNRAYFLNYCAAIPIIYADYIFKEKVTRPADEALLGFRTDVDGRGTSIIAFMRKVSILSSILGHIHIVIDMPIIEDTKGVTQRDVKEKDIKPRATIIYPQSLKDWSVDSNGDLNWVLIQRDYYEDTDPLIEREKKTEYKIISREMWEVYDKEGVLLDSGPNELGEVFLITCYNKDIDLDLIGESQLSDIAYINRAIFNWCSDIDEMIERQTFSQLICPDDGTLSESDEKTNPLKKLGTSSMFTFPADTGHPPAFISPDTSQIKVIWEMIGEHVKEIWRLAGLRSWDEGISMSQRSGVSMQFSFLDVNSALAAKSSSLEIVENKINQLCYRWLGKESEEPAAVNYPSSFDVLSLTESIQTTFEVVERNFSTRMNKELLKQLANKALPVLPEDIKMEIEKEIESGDGTIESISKGGSLDELKTATDEVKKKKDTKKTDVKDE